MSELHEGLLPRDRALRVYTRAGEVPGMLLYGLRVPELENRPDCIAESWPPGTRYDPPMTLWGPGWNVDIWTIQPSRWPPPQSWMDTLRATLECVASAGYEVSWFAVEGNFVDPPSLFDPDKMGGGILAAFSSDTGFLSNAEWGEQLRALDDDVLLPLRRVASAVWDRGAGF